MERMMKKSVLLCIVLCMSIIQLSAQEEDLGSFAVILYAEGAEISILRGGELERFNVSEDDVIGLVLLEGDILRTEDGSFLEIQLFPSKNIVKLAENTILEFERIGEQGGGDFKLLYGRILAQVLLLNETDQFTISDRSTVVEVSDTVFGFDYIVPSADSLVPGSSVYCFEGTVAVSLVPGSLPTGSDSELLVANEIAEVLEASPQGSDTTEVTLTKGPITPNVVGFWELYGIQSLPIEPSEIDIVFEGIWQRVRLARAGLLGVLDAQPETTDDTQPQVDAPVGLTEYPTIPFIDMDTLLQSVRTEEMINRITLSSLGGIQGILGAVTTVSGMALTFGGQAFGLNSAIYGVVGPGLMVWGVVRLISGLIILGISDN